MVVSAAPATPPGDVPHATTPAPPSPIPDTERSRSGRDPTAGPAVDGSPTAGRSPATSPSAARSTLADGSEAAAPVVPVARPVTVEIPTIGVETSLVDLDLDQGGRLEVPDDPARAGWFVRGPKPGEDGPAVIAGHVDSRVGPAVFWRLGELGPGDRITVHDADRRQRVFVVDRVERWPKDDFPTDAVYRQSRGSELRLVTCGGTFDRDTGHYNDNVIVFATAAHQPESSPVAPSDEGGNDH
nr:class F sortase [Salsipaludibacter albus]